MNDKMAITACYAECFTTALVCDFQEATSKSNFSQNYDIFHWLTDLFYFTESAFTV
jgi:hypothetical protein